MSSVYKLHLELNTELAKKKILRRYGKAKEGITRDILVSPNITLHALHYIIQQLFGWKNYHLHHFEYPQKVFDTLVNDSFLKWSKYCGVYFRLPSEDYKDIYWDDDIIDHKCSLKEWYRMKYNGPYEYHGMGEHFMEAQDGIRSFFESNEEVQKPLDYEEWEKLSLIERNNPKIVKSRELTAKEGNLLLMDCGDISELLERLTIEEVLSLSSNISIFDNPEKYDDLFEKNYNKFVIAHNKYMSGGSESTYHKAVSPMNPKVEPLSNSMTYYYDYGDGWEVKITLVEIVESRIKKPRCIDADGLPVFDDLGGIGGYCNFLDTYYNGNEPEDCADYFDVDMTKPIAREMGWKPTLTLPKNML